MKLLFKKVNVVASALVIINFSPFVRAELSDTCKFDERCTTSGVAAAAGTGMGIKSAKQFGKAELFERQNDKVAYQSKPTSVIEVKPNEIRLSELHDGARVTFLYNLNPDENRLYHIELYLEKAADAHSQASYHQTMSLTATKTVTEYNSKGEYVGSHQEPDRIARMYHASQAASYTRDAFEFESEARLAENPNHPIPTHVLENVIGADKDQPARATVSFLEERTQHQSKILEVRILSKTAKDALAKMTGKALRTGFAAGVLLTGAAVEMGTGYTAQKIEDYNSGELRLDFIVEGFDLKGFGN